MLAWELEKWITYIFSRTTFSVLVILIEINFNKESYMSINFLFANIYLNPVFFIDDSWNLYTFNLISLALFKYKYTLHIHVKESSWLLNWMERILIFSFHIYTYTEYLFMQVEKWNTRQWNFPSSKPSVRMVTQYQVTFHLPTGLNVLIRGQTTSRRYKTTQKTFAKQPGAVFQETKSWASQPNSINNKLEATVKVPLKNLGRIPHNLHTKKSDNIPTPY